MELKIDNSVTYALALEGGGAKGAWQIGAWRALEEAGIRIGAVAGASVGALNGALITMGDLKKAENIWKNITFSQVMDVDDRLMEKLFRGDLSRKERRQILLRTAEILGSGGFDVTPLQNWIRDAVSEEQVRAAERELYIVTMSLTDHKELELRARDLPDGELWDMLLASAYFPAFKNKKLGGKRYTDGGTRDNLPLHVLIKNGWQNILALRLFGVGVPRPTRIPRSTTVLYAEPSTDLGGTLEFTAEQSRANLTAGYYDMQRLLYGLNGYEYYIDMQWTEDDAYDYLLQTLRNAGFTGSRREADSGVLTALSKKLGGIDGGYEELASAVLERCAAESGTERMQVYTENELVQETERNGGGLEWMDRFMRGWKRQEILTPASARRGTGEKAENSIRVCLMNDSFPPVIDGVANAVTNYARILNEKEGSCVVATPEVPGAVDDYPYPVIRYPSVDTTKFAGYRTGNPFAPGAVAKLSEMGVDLIHTHCPIISTMLARSLRETISVPVVFTYHTKFDIDIQKAIRSEMLQETAIKALVGNISACDEVWVVSEGAGANLRSLGYRGDYLVMPNGVDLTRGRASEDKIQELSRRWDLPEDVPVYLFLGRIMWYKGLHILLDGLKKVQEAGRDFRMVFVGDGQDRPEVEAEAEKLGLMPRCRFVGAEHDREIVRAWYCRADLLLFPSTFDTNGLVVREAAACDLGTLLIEGSCAAEGIENDRTGILVPETAEGLAAALLAPDAGMEKFRRIGETAGREIYISWEESVEHARAEYRDVLRRWKSGELRRKRAGMDAIFNLNGELGGLWGETVNRSREAIELWTRSLEKAKERLDRYI